MCVTASHSLQGSGAAPFPNSQRLRKEEKLCSLPSCTHTHTHQQTPWLEVGEGVHRDTTWKTLFEGINGSKRVGARKESQNPAQAIHISSRKVGAHDWSGGQFRERESPSSAQPVASWKDSSAPPVRAWRVSRFLIQRRGGGWGMGGRGTGKEEIHTCTHQKKAIPGNESPCWW